MQAVQRNDGSNDLRIAADTGLNRVSCKLTEKKNLIYFRFRGKKVLCFGDLTMAIVVVSSFDPFIHCHQAYGVLIYSLMTAFIML